MQRMTLGFFLSALKAQGVPKEHMAFKCPVCSTIQSAADLIKADAGKTFEEVEPYLGFSCIGRFTGAGEHKPGEAPGRGCNWTLGGLLHIHKLEVLDESGKVYPRFVLATPEEAHRHMEEKS